MNVVERSLFPPRSLELWAPPRVCLPSKPGSFWLLKHGLDWKRENLTPASLELHSRLKLKAELFSFLYDKDEKELFPLTACLNLKKKICGLLYLGCPHCSAQFVLGDAAFFKHYSSEHVVFKTRLNYFGPYSTPEFQRLVRNNVRNVPSIRNERNLFYLKFHDDCRRENYLICPYCGCSADGDFDLHYFNYHANFVAYPEVSECSSQFETL